MAIINPPRGRDQSYEQHHKRKVQEPPAPHRPMRFRQKPPSSPGMLSPDMANIVNMRTRIHNPVHTSHTGSTKPKSNNATTDVRVSVSQSVYGGIASPRIHVPPAKNGSLNPSPVLAYLAPSPKQEYTTPVLPYLASAASSPRNEGAAPVIVIEAASPTIDSESEYADTEAEDEAGALYVNDGYTHARRTGLIGSPHGFVLPSATSSSSSLYSISGYVTTASSSASTIIPLESSTSSAFALSSSSSDDSSVTVKAAMTQEVRMRRPDTDSRRYTACSGSGVSVSWIPRDFDELEKEGLRGIAF
ncbi:hypothetical protein K439DRAFT_185583 [Ramaria rubella]|nr:hypothetical protein K439DRAFT_185583 [Ramaria rubella]